MTSGAAPDLLTGIRAASFEGISGNVRFLDNGDRDPLSIRFTARSMYLDSQQTLRAVTFGAVQDSV